MATKYVVQMSKEGGNPYQILDKTARAMASAEVTAREAAIAAEKTAREAAIAAEKTARETADANLTNALGNVPSGKTAQGQITDLQNALGTVPTGKTAQGQITDNANDITDLKSAFSNTVETVLLVDNNLFKGARKGYWDWYDNDTKFYFVDSNEFISPNAAVSVKGGQLCYIKLSNQADSIQYGVQFAGECGRVFNFTYDDFICMRVPDGADYMTVQAITTKTVAQFGGFDIYLADNLAQLLSSIQFIEKVIGETDSLTLSGYEKGYWDWVPAWNYDLNKVASNEFIQASSTIPVSSGQILSIELPSDMQTSQVGIVYGGSPNKYSEWGYGSVVSTVPDGVFTAGIETISTKTVSEFGGFNVKIYLPISETVNDLYNVEKYNPAYAVKDTITKQVIVDCNGHGDYTTITAAYAAISDSSALKEYEVIVLPGTYKEVDLHIPPFTHTHGVMNRELTIVTSEGMTGSQPVFEQAYSSKLSNMTIISGTGYCIHYDNSNLYKQTIHNENLYLKKLANTSNEAIIGGGSYNGGCLFEWVGCLFENGLCACHTNPWNYQDTKLVFKDCSLSQAQLYFGSIGGFGHNVCVIENMRFKQAYGASLVTWNGNMRTEETDTFKFLVHDREWEIIGGGNENFNPAVVQSSQAKYGLAYRTSALNKDIELAGNAVSAIFGEVQYRKGFARGYGYAYGILEVEDKQQNGADVFQLWKRLGDCSVNNKTLTVTVDGTSQTYTFNQNYLSTKPSEETILNAINYAITIAVLEKYSSYDNPYYTVNTTDKTRMIIHNPNGVLAGEFVRSSGYGEMTNIKNNDIIGIALENGAPGESVQIWSGRVISGPWFSGLESGRYGVGANGALVLDAEVAIGTLNGNVFIRDPW